MTIMYRIIALALVGNCVVGDSLTRQILDDLLNNNTYDNRIPPGLDLGDLAEERPTNITIHMFLTQIFDVNVNEMDFSITCYLHQQWTDHRLKFNYPNVTLQLPKEDIDKLWTPDTFFPRSKSGSLHTLTKPNSLMHVFHNGTVKYSIRLNAKLGCFMEFQLYPVDVQTCKIYIESYGFTSKRLVYSWRNFSPVRVGSENLPLYDIPDNPETATKTCHTDLVQEGFSCLEVTIELRRHIGYYMTEVFIPDILIVVLSWVTFWLHPLAVPGRVSLGAVTVLTMSSQGSASRRYAPKVSYVKAVDVWTLFQIMFVFAAMVEFSVVNVLARKKISERTSLRIAKEKAENCRESQGNANDPDTDENRRPFLAKAKKIDMISRISFPALYLFFNFLFWIIVTNV